MQNYTIIDILHTKWERKSKDCTSDEIIKIDAVKLLFDETNYTFEMTEKFLTLVKPKYTDPQKLYDFFSYRLDGFSADDLKNAHGNAVSLKRLREFIDNSEVIMLDVDESAYLFACGNKYHITFPSAMGNIESIAQELFGDCKRRFGLMDLARYFDLDFKTRNAETLAKVFIKLYQEQYVCASKQPQKDTYYTPLYREIVRRNTSHPLLCDLDCEKEIRTLQQAKLGEAFMLLVDILNELSEKRIIYRLNGAINISKLAYCSGIVDAHTLFSDYYFARFVNPYRADSLKAPHLSVSIDISEGDISAAEKIMREFASHYPTDKTMYAISLADSTGIPDAFTLAEKFDFSVLDIVIYPLKELTRYVALKSGITNERDIKDKEVFEYIQNNRIKIFDNAEKYLHALREIKLKNNIEYVILAMSICDSGRTDELSEIVRYQKEEHPFCWCGIDGALYYSCGVLMYQEQAMNILCELSGCSQFYADNIRKAMAKRDRKALENYKQAFLFGGDDVDGMHFCGCADNDKIEIGKDWWTRLCEAVPKLILKAHETARTTFFLKCAKLQMQGDKIL